MSLICVHCGKIIVLSDNPDHLAGCSACDISKEEGKQILESSKQFHKLAQERSK